MKFELPGLVLRGVRALLWPLELAGALVLAVLFVIALSGYAVWIWLIEDAVDRKERRR